MECRRGGRAADATQALGRARDGGLEGATTTTTRTGDFDFGRARQRLFKPRGESDAGGGDRGRETDENAANAR